MRRYNRCLAAARRSHPSARSDLFTGADPGALLLLVNALRYHDRYMVTADFDAYYGTQRRIDQLWRSASAWTCMRHSQYRQHGLVLLLLRHQGIRLATSELCRSSDRNVEVRNAWAGGCRAKCRTFAATDKPTERMARREFATKKNFQDYAERTGQGYLWEGTPHFAKRQRVLSPDQYEIVDVRTSRGMRRAMLFPKPAKLSLC